MKVFRINEGEWYAAETLEDAITCARDFTGQPDDELFSEEDPPQEVTEEEMSRHVFHQDDGTKCSFTEELARRVHGGEKFPCHFASADW